MKVLLAALFVLLVFCVVRWMLMDPVTHYARHLHPVGIVVMIGTVFAGVKGFFSIITS